MMNACLPRTAFNDQMGQEHRLTTSGCVERPELILHQVCKPRSEIVLIFACQVQCPRLTLERAFCPIQSCVSLGTRGLEQQH